MDLHNYTLDYVKTINMVWTGSKNGRQQMTETSARVDATGKEEDREIDG
jgi:hypothetical protein